MLVFSIAKPVPTFEKLLLPLMLLGGLVFLIDSLRPGQGVRNRRLEALAGLLLLSHVGLVIYWLLDVGLIQSQVIANAFYFCSQLSGGMSAAVLLFIVNPNPKSAKVLLGISCLSFLAFNLFGLGYSHLRHVSLSGIRLYFLVNGLLIGTSIPSAIYYSLDERRKGKARQNGD